MVGAVTFDEYKPVPNRAAARKEQREDVSTSATATGAAATAESIPFIAPTKKADLTNTQLKSLLDLQQNARDELKTFEGLEVVKTYDQGLRYFASALTVPKGAEGDQDLITLAAKVQDPTGAVMQGDIDRYNNVQVALDYVPQWMRNQFNKEGQFTPETRQRIIAFLRNRIDTYRLPYEETRRTFEDRIGGLNEQLAPLGVKPVEVNRILPQDPLKLYGPKIEAYDRKVDAERIRKEREEGAPTEGLMGRPAGTNIEGEDVKGWRLSPESEAEVVAYSRKPDATAQGYAQLLADKAVAEGHILPSQKEDYIARTASDSTDFFKQPAQQRAGVKGIDYSQIDKAASENAGLLDTVAQTARNLPETTAQLFGGLTAIPADAALSALTQTRQGTIKSFTDLAAELGQGQWDGPTTTAFADALKERYGSLAAIKRTGIKDFLGLLGDVSLALTAGGSGVARLGGTLGKVGQKVATAGRVIDPVSGIVALGTEGAPAAYRAAEQRMPGAVQGVEDLPSEIVGLPSGTGGTPVREATAAGFERGETGAPTPRSDAFTEAMRNPNATGDDLITAARTAVSNLREGASNAYRAAMQQFGQNPAPLDINVVRQRLQKLKPRSYDTWSTRRGARPTDHVAWEQMNDFVEEYAAKAAKDPTLLDPLAMDQFKQDLFDIGSKVGGQYDRSASRIAKSAYQAVRQELVKHDPIYADIMRDYERAATEAQQLETTFGLAAASGKRPNVESATRRLQAAMRNNAYTNYGQRTSQVERLNELDPDGTIVPTLAGSTFSSWRPRGLNTTVGLGLGLPAALTNPAWLALAPLFSPRFIGETAYGVGRLAGTGKRAFNAAANSRLGQVGSDVVDALGDLYQRYPTAGLAAAQAGSRLNDIEDQQIEDLAARYNLQPPAMSPAEYSSDITVRAPGMGQREAQPEQGPKLVPGPDGVFYLMQNGQIDPTPRDQDGNPIQQKARGGLMSLARKYR